MIEGVRFEMAIMALVVASDNGELDRCRKRLIC
nr:MAG TPA: hypothetical protein [Caudoviricetes sp.]